MSDLGHYPQAQWRPITINYSAQRNRPRLLIAHIMQGTLAGTDAWFRDPESQVSAHFGVAKSGEVIQWVNTNDQAWQAVAANGYSIGVEHEGWSGQPLTSAQLDAAAAILAWAAGQYPAIDLWLNTRPETGSGLSWHGLGGLAWGNHPDCPGPAIVHQLGDILEHAIELRHAAVPG
jgi:hypothetical protein